MADNEVAISLDDVRNCIRIVYGPALPYLVERDPENVWERVRSWFGFPPRHIVYLRSEVVTKDPDSIARYGVRHMEIVMPESWTGEMARELADSTIKDLNRP